MDVKNGRLIKLAIALGMVAAAIAAGQLSGPASAANCPPPPTELQPFAPWGDNNPYVLNTGGSFEPGSAPWELSGGATVVAGDNAPNALDPSIHKQSLYLPAGSSAISACTTAPKIVGIVRFFVKNSGVSTGTLRVDVVVKGKIYPAGTISAGTSWAPSPILTSTAPAYKGAVTYQLRLTPVGAGAAFTVDDVYFDPYCSK
jgi:hypothetical protein